MMLERYLEKVSAENSSEPIIKAAIELAAFTVKEGPVALCSCLSYFIAANRRLNQEVKILQQEIEDFRKHCSCLGQPAKQIVAPLLPFSAKTKLLEDCHGVIKNSYISQEIGSTRRSRKSHQLLAALGSSLPPASIHSPYTQESCAASPKHWTNGSNQNHCDSSSISDQGSSTSKSHVHDNFGSCWPDDNTRCKRAEERSSAQQDSAPHILSSGRSFLTVVAEIHTRSPSTQTFCEPSDKNSDLKGNLGSECCGGEETCDQPEESEIVSPLPLLGCLCKACIFLLQDPASAIFTLDGDTEEGILVPGNRVVVETCCSPVTQRLHEKDTNTHPGVSPVEPLSPEEAPSQNLSCNAIAPQISATNVLEAICNADGPADTRTSLYDTLPDGDQPSYQETCSGDFSTSPCEVDESDEFSSSYNGDQVVTVVYFGHNRETRLPRDPLQPQPVGIVALFEDGVERFVPLSRVMYHLTDEKDKGEIDCSSNRSLSPHLMADMTPIALPEPGAPDITPATYFAEESSRDYNNGLRSYCKSTCITADSNAQDLAVTHPIDFYVGRSSPVSSFAVDSVPLNEHIPLAYPLGTQADVLGSSHTSNKLSPVSVTSGVSVPPDSSIDAGPSDAVERRPAAILRRSQSDVSCGDCASSTASHSLGCLSLFAGDTGRHLDTSSDSGQWAHVGYDNTAYITANDEFSKPRKENTGGGGGEDRGGCNDPRCESSLAVNPPSGIQRNADVRLDLHDASLYESSDSAISISFANSQQSSFWSTTSSSGRTVFQSISVKESPARSRSQCIGVCDAETNKENRVMKPVLLNSETSVEMRNPERNTSSSEDSGTDILNRALNVFRRRNSAVDVYQLRNVSNV